LNKKEEKKRTAVAAGCKKDMSSPRRTDSTKFAELFGGERRILDFLATTDQYTINEHPHIYLMVISPALNASSAG